MKYIWDEMFDQECRKADPLSERRGDRRAKHQALVNEHGY